MLASLSRATRQLVSRVGVQTQPHQSLFAASLVSRRFASSSSSDVQNTADSASSSSSVEERPAIPAQIDIVNRDNNTSPTVFQFLNGVPSEELKHRRVRITTPTRNVMQSGEAKLDRWVITWDTQERWSNPLMGWASSADPLSNVDVKFDSKQEAIAFCERNGWTYYVHEPCRRRRMKKNYGNNFSWDKRTRKNTK